MVCTNMDYVCTAHNLYVVELGTMYNIIIIYLSVSQLIQTNAINGIHNDNKLNNLQSSY